MESVRAQDKDEKPKQRCFPANNAFSTSAGTERNVPDSKHGMPPRSPEEVSPDPTGVTVAPLLSNLRSAIKDHGMPSKLQGRINQHPGSFTPVLCEIPSIRERLVLAVPTTQDTPQEAAHAYWALAGMHASIAAPHLIFPEEARISKTSVA